jgi:hypothetical protein
MENKLEYYQMLINTYDAMRELDEYSLQAYLIKEVSDYLNDFKINNMITLKEEQDTLKRCANEPLRIKYIDSLVILKDINNSKELRFLIKKKIRDLNHE